MPAHGLFPAMMRLQMMITINRVSVLHPMVECAIPILLTWARPGEIRSDYLGRKS